jgi:hypothetical protein
MCQAPVALLSILYKLITRGQQTLKYAQDKSIKACLLAGAAGRLDSEHARTRYPRALFKGRAAAAPPWECPVLL